MKTKGTKRFGALLLALVMIFSLFPSSAFAAEVKEDVPAAAGEPAAAAEPAQTEGETAPEDTAPASEDGTTPASDDKGEAASDDKGEAKSDEKSDDKSDDKGEAGSDDVTYSVLLFVDGEVYRELGPYKPGADIGPLPTPDKPGFAFLGWLVNGEGEPIGSSYHVDGDMVLHASFAEIEQPADAAPAAPAKKGPARAPAAPVKGAPDGETKDGETPTRGDGETKAEPPVALGPYTIIWYVNGEVWYSGYVEPDMPGDSVNPPSDPIEPYEAEDDVRFEYRFSGWEGHWEDEDTFIYNALFTRTPRDGAEFNFTWKVEGQEDAYSTAETGDTPVYPGGTPTKEEDAQFTYEFSHWEPAIVPAAGDATYTAVFDSHVRTYCVTFNNHNGEELDSHALAYGKTPEYTGEEPTHEEEEGKRFVFTGWYPAIGPVTGDATYTAQFEEVPIYEITWRDHDDSLLGTSQVFEGETPVYPGENDPTRPDEGGFHFVFSGWDKEPYPAYAPETYVAVYTMKGADDATYYGLDFVVDGTNVAHITVKEGDAIGGQMPADPDAPAGKKFVGWFSGGEQITADTIVTGGLYVEARFEDIPTTCEITWKVEGLADVTIPVAYGETPVYPGENDPTREADAQYTYTFAGWDPEVVPVTADATYTAQFDSTLNEYTITFVDEDGETVLQESKVAYGETPEYTGGADQGGHRPVHLHLRGLGSRGRARDG